MKIIDFQKKGNVVRFLLGADDCAEYWGDDWGDSPYSNNAGVVYNEYITGIHDVSFPFDDCKQSSKISQNSPESIPLWAVPGRTIRHKVYQSCVVSQ